MRLVPGFNRQNRKLFVRFVDKIYLNGSEPFLVWSRVQKD